MGDFSTLDRQFDALADVRRRRLLFALEERNPRPDSPPHDRGLSRSALEREQLLLRHVHLPKLDAYGYVSWDREAHQVTKGPRFAEIRPLLALLREHADDLPEFDGPE
ncbi:hypothetical protein [Salinigranum marinum]|uniref:hypothetical protein n=1 Tax=Salinigranum marinum TaxID=1515595 RepID=UPI002989DB34|nr:hypothetical protein [Salinigranum marinum]